MLNLKIHRFILSLLLVVALFGFPVEAGFLTM